MDLSPTNGGIIGHHRSTEWPVYFDPDRQLISRPASKNLAGPPRFPGAAFRYSRPATGKAARSAALCVLNVRQPATPARRGTPALSLSKDGPASLNIFPARSSGGISSPKEPT